MANIEDILGIICMDKKTLQLLNEIRERISAKPVHMTPDTQIPKNGYCEKFASEYVRCGTAGIFMFTEPLAG